MNLTYQLQEVDRVARRLIRLIRLRRCDHVLHSLRVRIGATGSADACLLEPRTNTITRSGRDVCAHRLCRALWPARRAAATAGARRQPPPARTRITLRVRECPPPHHWPMVQGVLRLVCAPHHTTGPCYRVYSALSCVCPPPHHWPLIPGRPMSCIRIL